MKTCPTSSQPRQNNIDISRYCLLLQNSMKQKAIVIKEWGTSWWIELPIYDLCRATGTLINVGHTPTRSSVAKYNSIKYLMLVPTY